MRRVDAPFDQQKFLDTPSHTAASSLHALFHRSDAVHLFGVGNAAWLPILRLAGRGTVISVDGMDWRRRKWGRFARFALERSSRFAIRASGACITDSREVARYYHAKYGREPHYIAHGVDTRPVTTREALDEYGLYDRGYVLFVGRHHAGEGRAPPHRCVPRARDAHATRHRRRWLGRSGVLALARSARRLATSASAC